MTRSSLPLCAASAALALTLCPAAQAQEPPPPPAPAATQETTTSQVTGPSMAMVGSGLVIFGAAYVPSVVVAGASHLGADRALFVPIAGPWIDLTQRPGCAPATSCNAENAAKVGVVVDGIFQGVGVLTVLGGFLMPAHETRTVSTTADLRPTVHVAPAQVGGSGYGMMAVGSF